MQVLHFEAGSHTRKVLRVCFGLSNLQRIPPINARVVRSASRYTPNRQLTHRTVRTQNFPDFGVLGGLRATRTLPVVGRSGA
jgi:hypothetical protein